MAKVSLIYFKPEGRSQGCLVPSLLEDVQTVHRMKLAHGDVVTFNVRKERNGKHHRLVFQMLNFVFENQCRFNSLDAIRWHLALRTSFVRESMDMATGEVIRVPRSWSYEEMDEVDFTKLHSELYDAIIQEFYPKENVCWLKKAVNESAFLDGLLAFF